MKADGLWTVEPGRVLSLNGERFIRIERWQDRSGGYALSPHEADVLTRKIADSLNAAAGRKESP